MAHPVVRPAELPGGVRQEDDEETPDGTRQKAFKLLRLGYLLMLHIVVIFSDLGMDQYLLIPCLGE